MKTVRLPVYNGDMMTTELLEVDLNFFLSSTRGLRSNQARIIEPPLAQWERDLLENVETPDEVFEKIMGQHRAAKEEVIGKFAPAEEWKTIDKLPTKSFQVNKRGQIRHKFNQKIIEPSLDIDSRYYMTVKLMINGLEYFINGPKLAEEMWVSDTSA